MQTSKNTRGNDSEIQYAILGILLQPLYIKLMMLFSAWFSFPTIITTTLYYGAIWILILYYVIRNLYCALYNFGQTLVLMSIITLLFCAIGYESRKYVFGLNITNLLFFNSESLFSTGMFFFLGVCIQNVDEFAWRLHQFSKIGVIMGVSIILLGSMTGIGIHYDDMNYAYALGFMLCSLIAGYQKKEIGFVLLGVVCLLLAGTRGPLVCVMTVVVLRSVVFERNVKKILLRVGFMAAVIVFMYGGMFVWLLSWLNGIASKLGFAKLRLLEYANMNMLMDSSSRSDFNTELIAAIWQHPLIGNGIGADRRILGGHYSHNIILEIVLSLGVVMGSIMLLWILRRFTRMLFSERKACSEIGMAFFSGIFVKLLFSSSILYSIELFVFLGLSAVVTGKLKWRKTGGMVKKNEVTELAKE